MELKVIAVLATIVAAQGAAGADLRPRIGGDADAHGCIASAGYRWCPATRQCERPWELARAKGFENSETGFEAFCGSKQTK